MTSINVASVTAEVVPDARTFREKLDAQLKGLSATVDLKLVDEQVQAELDRISRDRTIKIKPTFDDKDVIAKGAASGAGYGGAFGKEARTRIDAALRALPELKIDASTSEADQKIKDLAARLETLRDQRISVDIPTEKAIAEIDAIKAELAILSKDEVDVTIKVNAARATAELEAFNAQLDVLQGGAAIGGGAASSGGRGGLIVAGLAAALTLVGPAAGAATAGVLGLTGAVGVGVLAYRGFKDELASGSAQGKQLQGQLDNISTSFDHLGSVAAAGASTGVISALSQIDNYLGTLDGPVAQLSTDLGDALSISAGALITGLETAGPLMQDVGGYAKDLAQHLADFAGSQKFEDFLAYAQRELPVVASTLGNLGEAFVNLAIALAPAGDNLLKDLDALAKGINMVSTASKYLHDINTLGGLLDFGPKADESAKALDKTGISATGTADALKSVQAMLDSSGSTAAVAAPIVDDFGNVLYDVDGKATDAGTAITNLENSIRGLGNSALDARSAQRSFEAAIDDATAAAKKNGKTLSDDTYAGRENATALDRIATSSHGVTAALVENHASQKQVTASMKEGRTAYIEAAMGMGRTRGEAAKLADQAGFTNADIRKVNDSLRATGKLHPRPTIRVDAGGAISVIDQVHSAIASLHDKHITITTTQQNNFNRMAAGRTQYRADGGPIIGPGTKTSDSIPIMGSNGEYMVKAAAVDKYGVAFFDQLNAMRLAGGGPVTQRPASVASSSSSAVASSPLVVVNPAAHQSEQEIGTIAARQIAWGLRL